MGLQPVDEPLQPKKSLKKKNKEMIEEFKFEEVEFMPSDDDEVGNKGKITRPPKRSQRKSKPL